MRRNRQVTRKRNREWQGEGIYNPHPNDSKLLHIMRHGSRVYKVYRYKTGERYFGFVMRRMEVGDEVVE